MSPASCATTSTGGNAHVFADLDGNGVADMEIVVNNVTTLTRADFLLSLPPAVAHEIDDAHGTEDAGPFSFQIPADAFADPEGDALSYVATLANGDPLPSWVSFDAATRTFSASPPHDFFGNFSVKVTVSDQDSSVSDTFEFFVHGVNDAPVLTATGSASSFTEGSNAPGTPVIVDPGLTLVDVDDVNMINATVGMSFGGPGDVLTFVNNDAALYGDIHQTNPAGGGGVQLSSNGAATLAQWQNALRSITYSNSSDDPGSFDRVVSFIVTDGTAFSNTVTKTVHIQPVNDSPRGTDATVTIAEDQAVVLGRADFGYSDPENYGFIQIVFTGVTGGTLFYDADGAGGNAPVAVAAFPASFSVSELDVGHLTFRPTADLNGAGAASISFQVQDSGGTDNGGHDTDPTPNTITYNVTAVNDAPLVDLNGAGAGTGGALAYAENAPLTAIAPGAVVGDPDTPNYRDGHLLVQMSQGVNGQDVLAIINQGTGPGQIGYSNGLITYEGIKIGDLLPSPMANFPVLDIRFTNADVSLAALQALVRAIGYQNGSDSPSTTPHGVEFQLTEPGAGGLTTSSLATITVAAVDDPGIAVADFGGDRRSAFGERQRARQRHGRRQFAGCRRGQRLGRQCRHADHAGFGRAADGQCQRHLLLRPQPCLRRDADAGLGRVEHAGARQLHLHAGGRRHGDGVGDGDRPRQQRRAVRHGRGGFLLRRHRQRPLPCRQCRRPGDRERRRRQRPHPDQRELRSGRRCRGRDAVDGGGRHGGDQPQRQRVRPDA